MNQKLSITVTAQGNKAQIRITGIIAEWSNTSNATKFKEQIDDLLAKGITEVELYLRTEGGDVFEANDIANEIKRFPGTITGTGGALVASAGTYLAVCCSTFSMPTNGQFMIHRPSSFAMGNIDEHESSLKLLRNLTDQYRTAYAAKTGLTEDEVEELWKGDYWMNAQEALDKKFIDSIIEETEPIDSKSIEAIKGIYKNVPTALLSITPTSLNNDNQMSNILKNLCVVLALADNTTDAEVVTMVTALKAKADQADNYKKQLETINSERESEKIKAMLDTAIENKQIVASERTHLEKLAQSDFASVQAMINARPKVTTVSTVVTDSADPTEDRSKWDYKEWAMKDPKALAKMATDDEPRFSKLFQAHYSMEYQK